MAVASEWAARGAEMVLSVRLARLSTVLALLVMSTMAQAQDLSSTAQYIPDSASPFGEAKLEDGEAATVSMPILAFGPAVGDAADFDKYYAFQRPGSDFATAYADIVECDGYARGLQSGVGYQQTPYMYAGTIAGVVGGAIGNVMAQAIFGSAEKRRLRRVNMRTCMSFKGYDRYGLPKNLWVKFNFEEGLSGVSDDKRRVYLKQQALVASSAQLQGKALGL